MIFGNPWLLLLLLVVPLISILKGKTGKKAAFLYSSVSILKGVTNLSRSHSGAFLNFLRWLAIIMFIVGLARPQIPEGETTIKSSGVDIILTLDLSTSMYAEDFMLKGERVNRLEVAKNVLRSFVAKRPNDRLGLVVFAKSSFLAVPLTLDHQYLLQNMERLAIKMIEDGTAIGDGLLSSVNRLKDLKAKSRIIILLTDGEEVVNEIPPLTAAEIAKSFDIKVYTVGVGTKGMAPYPQPMGPFGMINYINTPVNIDEETLTEIAQMTDGKYFRADNTDKFFEIYDEIDTLEKSDAEIKKYSRYQELFFYFVACGLVFLATEILLSNTILRTIP